MVMGPFEAAIIIGLAVLLFGSLFLPGIGDRLGRVTGAIRRTPDEHRRGREGS